MENQYIDENDPSFNEEDLIEESEEPEIVEEPSEPEEEESEEEEQRPRGRPPAHNRIQEIQREKYQAIEEANRLRAENEQLKGMNANLSYKTDDAINAGMLHYYNNASMKLEHAKAKFAQAVESGDAQAQSEANAEIASAASELNQIKPWKAQYDYDLQNPSRQHPQENYYQQPQQQQQYSEPYQVDPNIANSWAEQNSWFVAGTDDYNPELAQAAVDYSNRLENYLYRTGNQHLIMGEQYFQDISNYVSSLQNTSGRRQLNMKPARGGVSPVRGGGISHSGQGKQQVTLTADEKQLASRLGIKNEAYLQQKIRDMKEKGHKRIYGR